MAGPGEAGPSTSGPPLVIGKAAATAGTSGGSTSGFDDVGEALDGQANTVGLETVHEPEPGATDTGAGASSLDGPPTFHSLCQAGDTEALMRMKEEQGDAFDVDVRDEGGVTGLHWAAINAHVGTCRWLLEQGCEVDPVGGDLKATPLQWAARSGHLYILHLLLRYSADPTLVDSQGFTTLHLVTHSSVVMALLYVLHQPIAVDGADTEGHTALMWAAWQGDAISIDVLLRNGASVAARDHAGLTPLHWAAVKGSRACISRLVKAGADKEAKEEQGKTPRDMAEELKALGPWEAGMADAGLDKDGRKVQGMLSERNTRIAVFVAPTLFLYLIFSSTALPVYTGLPLAIGLFFLMHHLLTRVLLGAKTIGDVVSKSPYFAAIIAGSLVWVGYCWVTRLLFGAMGHLALNAAFGVLYIACCASFYRAIVRDPGYSRLPEDEEELKETIEDLTSKGCLNGTVFCISCMAKKPLRAKHCRLCDRCTGRFDHHCPWIWNCVGVNNHREFLVFVGTLVFGVCAFIALTIHYFSQNLPLDDAPSASPDTLSSAYPTMCTVAPSLCRASHYDPFLLSTCIWAGLQLTWTVLLFVSQVWQVCRQMTTLEVSNVGRYGWMGGRGGTSLRDQSGALAKMQEQRVVPVPGQSIFGEQASAQGSLAAIGAGAGPSGGDEDGLVLPDSNGLPIAAKHGHGHGHGHGGSGHHHRFGLLGKCCSSASMALGGPLGQLLGFDRFTKGKAVKGLTTSGGNPFDLGVLVNCQDFWTEGGALGVDYTALYDIPAEGFAARRRQVSRSAPMRNGVGLGLSVKSLVPESLPLRGGQSGDRAYELVDGHEREEV